MYSPSVITSEILTYSEPVLVVIQSFLNDQEVLVFFSLNKRFHEVSQTNKTIMIRLLQIRLRKTEKILNQIADPEVYFKKNKKEEDLTQLYFRQMNIFPYTSKNFDGDFIKKLLINKGIQIQNPSTKQTNTKQNQKQPIQNQQAQIKQTINQKKNSIPKKYNKEELELIKNEMKILFYFNPNNNPNMPQKQQISTLEDIKFRGIHVVNQISKNLCPVVHFKRFKQFFYQMNGENKVETKHI